MKPLPAQSTKARPQESASQPQQHRSRQEVGWRVTIPARPREVVASILCILTLCSLCSCTSTRAKMAQGYDLGQSDATKELYWSKVRMQQMQSQAQLQTQPPPQSNVTMYPIVHPAHTANGVNYKEYTDYIPVSSTNN